MSQSRNKDLLPLMVILESCGKIMHYIADFERAEDFYFYDDQSRFNASLMLLTNIGESTQKISTETKTIHHTTDWVKIKDLRNRIAHNYIGIDYEMVFDIILEELPVLISKIENLINTEIKQEVFDIEELKSTIPSPFYKHVNISKILS